MLSRRRHIVWQCALVSASALLPAAHRGRAEDLAERDFATAALVSSGIEKPTELAAWRKLYLLCRDDILSTCQGTHERQLPAAIHAALHERILTGRYRREASDLRQALADGDYNCLSALALYFDCCQAAGVEIEIWLRRGHVYARLPSLGGLHVEPSATEWVGLWPAHAAEAERRLAPQELLAKFSYNRGVEHLERGRFAEGLALLEQSMQLDPQDRDARQNYLAGLNNWAVAQLRERQYAEALTLIERGLSRDAAFAPLIANERLVRALLGK